MARNIEIKARMRDLERARAAALALGARPHAVEEQTDRYYVAEGGRRLKLRSFGGGRAELIEYDRPENAPVRASQYTVTPVRDREAGACLVPRGKPLVVVRKRREVLLWENVRIHLDRVQGLGTFLELEAVVDAEHDDDRCRDQVALLLRTLGVEEKDLLAASYADLLRGRTDRRR